MVGVHDVISEYIDILRNGITDPNASRTTEWIYDDIPRADLGGNKYPRISVISTESNPNEPHSLCSNQDRTTVRLRVQVRVRRSKWFNQTYLEFADDIVTDVINTLRSETSRNQLNDNVSVFDSRLEFDNLIYDEDLFIRELIYKNVMVR